MNIFFLNEFAEQAARDHCDKHVVKMILETAQLMNTAIWACMRENGWQMETPYRVTHLNHPCALWARKTSENFRWLLDLGMELALEYERRYNPKREHKSVEVMRWCWARREYIPEGKLTEPPQCMPDEYKVPNDPVLAYRRYYRGDKQRFAKWRTGKIPTWWVDPAVTSVCA